MRRGLMLLLVLGIGSGIGWAEPAKEETRMIIHTLNYLGQDYHNAVDQGKVVSESEYGEMLEFSQTAARQAERLSKAMPGTDLSSVILLIDSLGKAVTAKAPAEQISSLSRTTIGALYRITGFSFTPGNYPDLKHAKMLYAAHCQKCHGINGAGDGPEGKGLNPSPASFLDKERMKTIAPLDAFNTIRLGVEGTGMKAHPELSDQEAWDLAFYVIGFRTKNQKVSDEQVHSVWKTLAPSADTLAALNDVQLLAKYANTSFPAAELLYVLRSTQAERDQENLLKMAISLLDQSLEAYQKGNPDEAGKLALMAYLNGVEPVESRIKANNPELFYQLEEKLSQYRNKIQTGIPAAQLASYHAICVQVIQEAEATLASKKSSGPLVMLSTFSIIFREGLEAFLVVMVLLSILGAYQAEKLKKIVHLGWISAILLGVLFWYILDDVLRKNMLQVELMEGFIALLAVFMLLYIGFWLHGKDQAAKWKNKVQSMMQQAMASKSILWLGGLSFTVVFREVFESILFITAIDMESSGEFSTYIILGVLLSCLTVLILAYLVNRWSARLPIPKLFTISSVIMGILAVILTGKGIHSFQEAGWLNSSSSPLPWRIELLGVFPTTETLIAQCCMVILVAIFWRLSRNGRKAMTSH